MFGRSGQMFPRVQRPYHDAIYEEEYPSESNDECCRGKVCGILCWCFSIIFLFGLAISVVLTVFFVLKSRNMTNGGSIHGTGMFDDLDLFYGFKPKDDHINDTVTILRTTISDPTSNESSSEQIVKSHESLQEDDLIKKDLANFLPTTFRPQFTSKNVSIFERNHGLVTQIYPSSTTGLFISSTMTSLTSSTTTMPPPHTKDVMIFVPPYQDNLQVKSTTISKGIELPFHKNVHHQEFSSEETFSATTSHGHILFSMPPSSSAPEESTFKRKRPNRGPQLTSFTSSTEKNVELERNKTSSNRRGDLLEQIIKNLAPKFKNKTNIVSSRERIVPINPNIRIKTKIRVPTTSTTTTISPPNLDEIEKLLNNDTPISKFESNVFQEISPPDLTQHSLLNLSDSQEFLDILVGDEKRLVTKTSEDGVFTSAILPPWFMNENETIPRSDGPPNRNQTLSHSSPKVDQYSISDLHLHFEPRTDPPSFPTTTPKIPVTHSSSTSKKPFSFKDLLKDLAPIFPASKPSNSPQMNENAGKIHGNLDHLDLGNPINFYEENLDEMNDDFSKEDNERVSEDELLSPSHIIDIAYDRKQRPEIIIEQDTSSHEEDSYTFYSEPSASPSEQHSHIVDPPESFNMKSLNLSNPLNVSTTQEPKQISTQIHPYLPETPSQFDGINGNVTDLNDRETNVENPVLQEPEALLNRSTTTPIDPVRNQINHLLSSFLGNPEEDQNSEPDDNWAVESSDQENFTQELIPISAIPSSIQPSIYSDEESIEIPPYLIPREPVSTVDQSIYQIQLPSSPAPPTSTIQTSTFPSTSSISSIKITRLNESTNPQKLFYNVPFSPPKVSTLIPGKSSNKSNGFVPPKPIDFHSNEYTFTPSAIAPSGNGFFPVNQNSWRPVHYNFPQKNLQASMKNVDPSQKNVDAGSMLPSFSEALKLRPTKTITSTFDQNADGTVNWSSFSNSQKSTKIPIEFKPSQQIPPSSSPSQTVLKQSITGTNPIKFPPEEPTSNHQLLIDRTKYLHRPAPPPIVMRRTPQPPKRRGTHRQKIYRSPTHHYLSQEQRILKERIFRQQLAKLRQQQMFGGPTGSNGVRTLQWPKDQPITRRIG